VPTKFPSKTPSTTLQEYHMNGIEAILFGIDVLD